MEMAVPSAHPSRLREPELFRGVGLLDSRARKKEIQQKDIMKYLLMITAALALISTASATPSRSAAAGCCNGGACCKAHSACCKK
jgi:hypothetical protein